MSKKLILIITTLFFSTNSFALMEMGVDYGYSKSLYGTNKENKQTETTYSASAAVYFFTLTALEFSFSQSEQIINEVNSIAIENSTISITGVRTVVDSKMYGIGIKQSLAPRKARLRPAISIGYARQVVEDKTFINFADSSNGAAGSIQDGESKNRYDSVMASFSLQFFLTKRFAIKSSVRTIFPAFEFDQATDDLKYTVGLSWFL